MSALGWTLAWLGVGASGVSGVAWLVRRGLPPTLGRDLVHVGAGLYALGWPWFPSPGPPIALAAAVTALLAAAPFVPRLAPLRAALAERDETWAGIPLYGLAMTALTAAGTLGPAFPATAAVFALALGDGLGGAIGRRFGRTPYRTFGKPKSLEGSLAVLGFGLLGIAVAGQIVGAPPHWTWPLAATLGAAAEALAPRGTDNLAVPAAVFLGLTPGWEVWS